MCAGLAEAAYWPKERDAALAAPKNHRVIYETEKIAPAVQAPGSPEMPIMVRLPAQAEHSIHNIDTTPFHAIRIEYKKMCPGR